MTTAQVVETSVTVNNNSPIQDYVHLDDQTQPTSEMTPGFKPFSMKWSVRLCLEQVSTLKNGDFKTNTTLSYSECLKTTFPKLIIELRAKVFLNTP